MRSVAIKAGELDEAVVWKRVIIALQNERNKKVMEPFVDRGSGDDGQQIF
jgi:hypothetical protein